MRDKWYGDRRDLVKWATLLHICERHKLRTIIHVAFRKGRENWPKLTTDEGPVDISTYVWAHFRSLEAIGGLGRLSAIDIRIVGQEFDPKNRDAYLAVALKELRSAPSGRILFLDPDTGLAPKTSKAQHVTCTEIRVLWSALATGDWIVVYQHAPRRKDWKEPGRRRLANCLEVPVPTVNSFDASSLAGDVVFFALEKQVSDPSEPLQAKTPPEIR